MPYIRTKRRGTGAFDFDPLGTSSAQYDSSGRYLGGNMWMDIYCGSFLGSSDPVCRIPTPAQIKAQQVAELATTSASPEAQAAAIAAGDAAITADMAANPQGYQQQCAASLYPSLAAAIGPGTVASLFGIDTDCTENFMSGSLLWIGLGIGMLALAFAGGRR